MKDVEDITDKTYIANGNSTALLDAIGIAITETGKRLKEMNEKDRPAKVIMVIQTDGLENASREFTYAQVTEMIKHQEEKYNWKIVFLGASLDAANQGASIGVKAMNMMHYSQTS